MNKPINEITAKEIMGSKIVSVKKTDTLQDVLPILIKGRMHNLPVFDKGEFVGFFGYGQIARLYRKPLVQTRIGKYIIKPPEINESTGIIDASDYMYRLNYKILPVIANGILVGIVSERDILKCVIHSDELKGKKIEEFMTPEPLSINESDNIGTAFSRIRDMNLSRLPVINSNGEIAGVLESFDLMKEIFNKELDYGVDRSYNSNSSLKGSVTSYTYGPDKLSESKIPVSSIMNRVPAIAKIGDPLDASFKSALERNVTSIIVIDKNKKPVGIVVPKDIVSYIAKKKKIEATYIQVSGLESEEGLSGFEKEQVHRMIDDAVRKVASIERLQFFTMHYKSYRKEGAKRKYTIRCKADTDNGLYTVRDYGWDIIDTTSKILAALEDIIISRKQKIKTKLINRNRYGKWMKNEGFAE